MCQIFAGPSAKVRATLLNTAGLLEALFDLNSDGWGAMYHTKHGVKAIKKLPTSVADTRKYVEALPTDDRDVAIHWRMRTSGNIDTHNAHPHEADGGYVIHNGVLRDVDMSSNPDLCDTIHFCRQYLDGSIDAIVRSPGLQEIVGGFIGNNRFVILSNSGQMCIINKDQGYEVNGVWVANTYASPPELLIPGYREYVTFTGYGFGRRGSEWTGMLADLEDDVYGSLYGGATQSVSDDATTEVDDELAYYVDKAIEDYDVSELAGMLGDEELRAAVVDRILTNYEITPYRPRGVDIVMAGDVPDRTREAAMAWRDYDDEALNALAEATPHCVAEALAYYCTVDYCDPTEQPATNGNVVDLGNGFLLEASEEPV